MVRPYLPQDFPMVEAWWRQHHGNDFRPSYVPATAFIWEEESQPCGFFGVCPMTEAFVYFAFPLVNPDVPRETRDKTIDGMVDYAKMWTASAGFPILWISIRGEKFLNRLGDKGFVHGESGNVHMFCKVGEIA